MKNLIQILEEEIVENTKQKQKEIENTNNILINRYNTIFNDCITVENLKYNSHGDYSFIQEDHPYFILDDYIFYIKGSSLYVRKKGIDDEAYVFVRTDFINYIPHARTLEALNEKSFVGYITGNDKTLWQRFKRLFKE